MNQVNAEMNDFIAEKYFDATLSIENVTLNVSRCSGLLESDLEKFVRNFNEYGFVVVETKETEHPEEQLMMLAPLLGRVADHKMTDSYGVYSIAPTEKPDPRFPGTSNAPHPLHTDGAFLNNPEAIVALQCVVPAAEGGETTLASCSYIFKLLGEKYNLEKIQKLFTPGSLSIDRAGQKGEFSFLEKHENRIKVRYRDDHYADIKTSDDAGELYKALKIILNGENSVLSFQLQPNQILIVDNSAVLHGRKSFPEEISRHYNRMNFDGCGQLAPRLKYGIPSTQFSE